MSLLSSGMTPQPYGKGGRKVFRPIKANQALYMGGMLSELNGYLVPGTTAGAGNCVGVSENDATGGATDGATRAVVLTDQIFIFLAGTNAPTDATPLGSYLYMEDDSHVGTGGVGGSGEGVAGLFMGLEDDGSVRVFISPLVGADHTGNLYANGTALANTAAQTIEVVGRKSRFKCAALGQNSTVTLGTTGAVVGDTIRISRTDTSAFTLAVVNGGAGAGTLVTLDASKAGFAQAYFDGTNWQFDAAGIA